MQVQGLLQNVLTSLSDGSVNDPFRSVLLNQTLGDLICPVRTRQGEGSKRGLERISLRKLIVRPGLTPGTRQPPRPSRKQWSPCPSPHPAAQADEHQVERVESIRR